MHNQPAPTARRFPVWLLLVGGVITFVLGHFAAAIDVNLARALGGVGLLAVVAGAMLMLVRARRGSRSNNHP